MENDVIAEYLEESKKLKEYERYRNAIKMFQQYLEDRIRWTRECKALDCAQDEYYIWLMFCHLFDISIDERGDL